MPFRPQHRAALLIASALVLPSFPALANTAETADTAIDPDRDYLPSDIVVSGTRGGYGSDDGASATKTDTPLIDVPQTVAVITEDQLDDQSIRQLVDALRYVPGISIETGEGHRDEIFIRGQETTADFYLDGLRDDAQYYRSLYNIERVEVLKGANALIFGRGGGGGVVNRVSKRASLGTPVAAFDGSVDSFGAFALTGDVGTPVSDTLAVRLNATYEEFDNHRDVYEGRFIGISPTLTAQLGDATRLTATYSYDDDARVTDRGVPSLDGEPLRGFDKTFFGVEGFNDTQAEVHIARSRIDHEFSPNLRANASVQYASYDKIYANILPRGTNGQTVEFSGYQDFTDRENLIGQANLVADVMTGSIEHTILAGVEFSRQDTQNGRSNAQFASGTGFASRATAPLSRNIVLPAVSLTAPVRARDSNLDVFSAYLQDQISIGEQIEVIAGLRFDRFDLDTVNLLNGDRGARVDEKVSPRLGLVFKPEETLSFYASYATSFLPQSGDQFLLLSPGNAAFAPEKFTNYEIGAKWLPRNDVFVTAALFRLDRTNTRAADPNNTGLTVLTGASRTEGFEFNVVGEIAPGWEANIGYTYLDGEITTDSNFADAGTRLQQLPEHQIAAWNHVDLTDAFGVGLGLIHRGEQFASFSNDVVLPDYWRVDVAAFYEISPNVSVQLNIENLFDTNYYPSAHGDNNIQPGEPFNVRIGVKFAL
ncbi:Ferrichrysobactin receptor [Alteripontixanthobacter maritimus]|uniref:Ferrichrysobactin receptor n=1 Tax=Alteripontixanthobacter maritimus TaxID=2161824 RepID=A0A369Q341_9SPHN|nr:TonB-dependent siderophore receptor [Alteripontixanthobacter maritimus]RDC59184.1 Ferrichrysobactin receptor [Alteripontixanthobacter maritimus]